jgi:CelD/BcsL family acetyltransferase involved in cellulose biosynthesis
VRVEVVTDDCALGGLAPAWQALWRRSGADPFRSAAWMLAWWRYFGTGHPVVAVAREGGDTVGLLACYLLDEPAGRRLLPMGAGITDYQDALGAGGPALLAAVLETARQAGAAACDFTDLPPGAVLRTLPVPAGWRDRLDETDACPVLGSPAVPPGRQRDRRQALHRAERLGGCAIEVAEADTLGPALETLFRLHAARWRACGGTGVLADPRVLAFHRLAAPALLAEGALRLAVLRIAGTPAAACHALLAPGHIFFYLGGFDPAFSYESPGTILLGHLIEQALAEGRGVHFLRGAEPYKYAWGGVERMNATRTLTPL